MEVVSNSKPALWCEKCQRGITGHPEAPYKQPGDICPICSSRPGFAAEDMGILEDLQEYADRKATEAKFKRDQIALEQKRKVRETPEDIARKIVDEKMATMKSMEVELESLRSEMASMREQQKINEVKISTKSRKKVGEVSGN